MIAFRGAIAWVRIDLESPSRKVPALVMGIEIEGALIVSRLKLSTLMEDNIIFKQVIHTALNMNDIADWFTTMIRSSLLSREYIHSHCIPISKTTQINLNNRTTAMTGKENKL